jgi:WD40 repeat protein
MEPIGISGEANKDNSGESDQPDQTTKTEADLHSNKDKKEDNIKYREEDIAGKDRPKEAAPEITIVQSDQAKKSSSKENLTKSPNTDDNNGANSHNKDSLNGSKELQPTNGVLKTSENIPANLSPQKPEELTPKKTYVMVKMSQPFKSYVTKVRFLPGSSTMVTCASNDGNLMLYDCATNEVKFTLNAHKKGIVDFDWSFNNDHLLTCGKDNIIRLWNVAQQKKITSYKLGTGINCIRFHPMNNNQFIIGDAKGSVHVNNISNARSVILEFPPHENSSSEEDSWSEEDQPVTNSISTIEVGSDGYLLTGDCVGQMRVYKSLPPEFNFTLMKAKKLNTNCPLMNFIMDTENKTVWLNTNDNQIKKLSYSNLEPFKVSFFNQTYSMTGSMSNNGLVASLIHGSPTVTLINPDTSAVVDQLEGPNEIVNQAEISHDEKYVVAGTIKGSIVVWELTEQDPKPHSPGKKRRSIQNEFQTLVNTVNNNLA